MQKRGIATTTVLIIAAVVTIAGGLALPDFPELSPPGKGDLTFVGNNDDTSVKNNPVICRYFWQSQPGGCSNVITKTHTECINNQCVTVKGAGQNQCESVKDCQPILRHVLTIEKFGEGAGTIHSSPAGITCGSDCSEFYNPGTTVTLTATAEAGSEFTFWGGACWGTPANEECTVMMDGNKNVVAVFNQTNNQSDQTFTLTVNKFGDGQGLIHTPSGIDCGTDCSEVYDEGTVVNLGAFPQSGSFFGGWFAACQGTPTNENCTLTMNSHKNVDVVFNLTSNQTQNLSDLVVADIFVGDSDLIANGSEGNFYHTPVRARIWNIGQATAGNSITTFRFSNGFLQGKATGSLSPNQTRDIWVSFNSSATGTFDVNVTTDYFDVIAESNENNNNATWTFTVPN